MSKLTSLIVALVIGSSSVAMAAPAATFSVSAHASAQLNVRAAFQPIIRDHRTPTPVRSPVRTATYTDRDRWNDRAYQYDSYNNNMQRFDWLQLGTMTLGTRNPTQSWITMPTNEPIHLLNLQPVEGRPQVELVVVRYHDGTQEVIYLPSMSRNSVTVGIQTKAAPIQELVFQMVKGSSGTFNISAAL